MRVSLIGDILKFITIKPTYIRLNGDIDQEIKQVITIIPETEPSFKIEKAYAKNGTKIAIKLSEYEVKGKTEYKLRVMNTSKIIGRYSDTIYLETDSKIREKIQIRVYGHIDDKKKAEEVSPSTTESD